MGTIVVSENVSLDGVVQDPTGDEGFDRGGWFTRTAAEDREAWGRVELQEAVGAAALLLGRRSDAFFADRWLDRTGEWADRLNDMPKYVVSSTLSAARWSNATVLSGPPAAEAARLQREVEGEIVVYASATLVHSLVQHDLVDEFRLTVFPVVIGAGRRLFAETPAAQDLQLVDAGVLGSGLTHLIYRRKRGG